MRISTVKYFLISCFTLVLWFPSQAAEPLYKQREYHSIKRSVGNRPNIILITLDHFRVDNVAANGYPHMLTPNMDQLVKGGQSFVNYQIAANACMPSRASLFSARFPQNHGVITNGVPMPEDEICIQHVLQENGYFTGQIGKLHFWPHKERDHRGPHPPYGFDEMLLCDEPGSYDDAYGKWLEAKGPGEVDAGDIVAPADFEIVNPELHLGTLDSAKGTLNMEFNVERGTGYVPAQQVDGYSIGTLPVDAIFSPVRKVNYSVEYTRVGQITDYERLIIEVWTDRTISPLDAVHTAAKVLMDHSALLIGAGEVDSDSDNANNSDIPAEIYNVTVEKLELSSRTLNCLKRAGINKVGEVLERTAAELLKIRNFGEKSLEELRARLEENNLPVPDSFLGRGEDAEASDNTADDVAPPDDASDAEEDEESVTEFPKED